jgi:K+-sensing histidine kinase KdpD
MARDTLTPRTERLLVCLGPGASAAGLINAAGQMAAGLKAKWFVLFVEDPRTLLLPEEKRHRVFDNLRLAEQLGAETHTLSGRHIAEEIINFAPGTRSGRPPPCMVSAANWPEAGEGKKSSGWPCNISRRFLIARPWPWS